MPKEKKNKIQKTNHFSKLVNIVSSGEVNKPNCKLCQSKFRKEAEKKYAETSNFRAVERLLKDNKEYISYLSIRNHLIKHFLYGERQALLKDWAEDLDQYAGGISDKRQMILERIVIMRREICMIASESDLGSMDERRKNAESIKKLSDGISSLEDRLEHIDGDLQPVEIVIENLKDIIYKDTQATDNEEVKRALMSILPKLLKNLSSLESIG